MKFNELITLLEMPLRIAPIDIEERGANDHFNKYNNYEKVGEFRVGKDMIDVFIHTSTYRTSNKIYNMVLNNRQIATYSGNEVQGGIITAMVNSYAKKYNVKGLLFYFYIYFLLNKYKFVLSDDSLTEKGMNFWNYNFDNFIKQGLKISVVEYINEKDFKEIKQLSSREELNDFYGDLVNKPLSNRYRYMVSK